MMLTEKAALLRTFLAEEFNQPYASTTDKTLVCAVEDVLVGFENAIKTLEWYAHNGRVSVLLLEDGGARASQAIATIGKWQKIAIVDSIRK